MAFVNDILDPWQRMLIDIHKPSDYSAVVSESLRLLRIYRFGPGSW